MTNFNMFDIDYVKIAIFKVLIKAIFLYDPNL